MWWKGNNLEGDRMLWKKYLEGDHMTDHMTDHVTDHVTELSPDITPLLRYISHNGTKTIIWRTLVKHLHQDRE